MEWERAKSYLLVFFVLLNLTLGGLLLFERRRYTVTPEREQAIVTIMNQNNIAMGTRLMRRFPPMRGMYVAGFYYDEYQLVDIFFGDADVRHVNTLRGHIFTYGSAVLNISHGFISYDNPEGHGGPDAWLRPLDRVEAQGLTDAFVRAHWSDFRLDDVFVGPDSLRFAYRQVYRGYVIHSNFIEIIVTDRGIVQVEMQFGQVLDWADEARPIIAPDLALLTFVQRVRAHALAQAEPMVVTHMDLVFFQEEGSPDPDAYYPVVPFYRVFIYGDGRDPFLINAFTNEIIN